MVRRSGPQLSGKRIVIDPGLGGADTGLVVQTPNGPVSEADILWDLASRLEGRMAATGMETFLSRPQHANPSEAERAETSNGFDADLMIALRCDSHSSPAASGVASYHFGNSHGSTSMIGQILTGFIQREIVARTPLRDCRTHGRTGNCCGSPRCPPFRSTSVISQTNPTCGCSRIRGRGTRSPKPS